jgi:hypothetical protein
MPPVRWLCFFTYNLSSCIRPSTQPKKAIGRRARLEQKEKFDMAKKSPWHSTKQTVHHNNTECNTGNNIEKENLRQGTGGKPLCKECERLG